MLQPVAKLSRRPVASPLAALTGLLVLPFGALAQTETPPARIEEVLVSAPEPRYVAPTTRDHIGRIWAPVTINGQGPFRLVLDTGATRSAIMQRVADDARLPLHSKPVHLRGVTGTRTVPAARIETLAFGDLLMENLILPIVPDAFGGADGVLGGEGLRDKRVVIEFRKDRISIARSHGQTAPAGFSVVPFKYVPNRGMRISVMVGSVRTTALIDTGSEATVGNLALRQALSRHRNPREVYDEGLIGVTEDLQQAARVHIPSISAGKLLVQNVAIMFSDLQIFQYWQLTDQPALLIGMDVLGVVDALIIDYRRSELQFRTSRSFGLE